MMSDDVVTQLIALNAPPEVVEAARARAGVGDQGEAAFEVWEENWTAVMLFRNLGTQWEIVSGMAGMIYLGLKNEVVPEQMDRLRISRRDRPQYWDALDLMVRAALPLMNK